jgi:cobalt/nickel transport system permease protein
MTPQLDRFAHLNSVIHRWDPRWKIAALALLLLALALERPGSRADVSLARDIAPALAGLVLSITVLLLTKIPLGFVARRLVAPGIFLAMLVVLMPLLHPEKDLELGSISLSRQGFAFAGLIALRALAMLILVFPMFSTARFDRTMKALRRLHLPSSLVQIFFFTYRYLFVYTDQFARLRRAMRARGFVPLTSPRTLRTIGNGLGIALVTSIDRTRRIHEAMRCRGYTGEISIIDDFKTRGSDIALFVVSLALAVALVLWRMT